MADGQCKRETGNVLTSPVISMC